MPTEQTSRRAILEAIQKIPSLSELLSRHDGHYTYELDMEVVVYGRNYNGKKVGPYVRLLNFAPDEVIVREGDWGGNTFYCIIEGLAHVYKGNQKVAELPSGAKFGEAAVLAGAPRNASVKAPPDRPVTVLEVQRPALRLLRKLPRFGESLDQTYRSHSRDALLEELRVRHQLSPELVAALRNIGRFRALSKHHVLCRQGAPVAFLYFVRDGWLRRVRRDERGEREDFIGGGHCIGVEALSGDATWPETIRLMARTEVFEIPVAELRDQPQLAAALREKFGRFAPPGFREPFSKLLPEVRGRILTAQEKLIATGLVDATNLMVMDMDLCVRCGNCSLACHKIHGQSRLVRRGIHLTRLEAPRPSARQSLLAPQVCLHCRDAECVTGCPTGAIGRFTQGQIDIDPKSCIGCSDCATQCPYNAISMVPRRSSDKPASSGFGEKLRDLLRLSADPLPPPVETVDDLVAVKCNLCSDRTTLNPPGAKQQAYSCEENCPTGALARINPKNYFNEIENAEGLMFVDAGHAVGRNIHRSDPGRSVGHVVGIVSTLLLTALTVMGLATYGMGQPLVGIFNMRWLTGLVGLLGIAGVMAYPARRQIYRKRAGALRYWLLSHLYLGVIGGIMILLHGGRDSGGLLTTLLMISFDLVILTGLFGVALYLIVPRLLTRIEGAPLLLDDLRKRREELQRTLAEAASPSDPAMAESITRRVAPRLLSFGYLLRQYLKRERLEDLLEEARREFEPEAARLRDQFLLDQLRAIGLESAYDKVRDVIDAPKQELILIASLTQASNEQKTQLRQILSQARERHSRFMRAVDAAVTLRRVDALIDLHRLLKIWLPPHVATTSLMLALMLAHIVQVIYYLAR